MNTSVPSSTTAFMRILFIVAGLLTISFLLIISLSNEAHGEEMEKEPLWTYTAGDRVGRTSISDDGNYIVTGGNDGHIRLFEKSSSTPLWDHNTYADGVDVCISANGEYIASGDGAYKIKLFHKDSSTPLWTYTCGDDAYRLAISEDGEYIAAASLDGKVYFFNKDSGTPLWSYNTGNAVRFVAVSENAEYIVAGNGRGTDSIFLFDRDFTGSSYLWKYETNDDVWSGDISADGEYIVAGTGPDDGRMFLFDKDSSTPLWTHSTGASVRVAISADGEYIISGASDNNAYFFHRESSTPLWTYTGTEPMSWPAISEHGECVFVTSKDNNLYSFDKDFTDSEPRWVYTTGDDTYYSIPDISADASYVAGGSSDEKIYVFKNNDRPVPTIDSITPNPVVIGKTISFQGQASDEDSIIEDYRWESTIDNDLGNEPSFDTDSISLGTHTISFNAKDDWDIWGTADTMELIVHERPTAEITSITPDFPKGGETITFTGSGVDDGSIDTYAWKARADGEFYNVSEPAVDADYRSLGVHTVGIVVQDNFGVWSKPVTAFLKVGVFPVATIDEIKPEDIGEGDTIWFYGNGADEDGVIEEYVWSLDDYSGDTSSFSLPGLAPGSYTVSFRVRDDDDLWSTLITQEFEVVDKEPVAFIDSINPEAPLETDSVTLTGHVVEFGTITAYTWESDIDGALGTESSISVTLSPGLHEISFKGKDDEGAWSEPAEQKIHVNDIPVATIKDGYPTLVNAGEELEIEGDGEDSGGISEYLWESDISGDLGDEPTLKLDDLTPGTHTITLKVADDLALWSEPVTITVKVNTLPTAMAGPDIHSFPHLEVQFNGQASDSDGTIARYEWDFDGNGVYEWSSTETGLIKYTYNNPGEFTAALRVTDNDGAQSSDSLVVTVDTNLSAEDGVGYVAGFDSPLMIASIGISAALVAIFRRRH